MWQVTNTALIFFLSNMIDPKYGLGTRVAGFALSVFVILTIKFLLAVGVPDTPSEVTTMLKRNKHLVDTLLRQRAPRGKKDVRLEESSSSDDDSWKRRPGSPPTEHTVDADDRDAHNASQHHLIGHRSTGTKL